MKNLWPVKFEPSTLRAPKTILEEQAGFLAQITGGLVIAELSSASSLDRIRMSPSRDFAFRLDIVGPFLDNFRFNVLLLSHDVALYPVAVMLEEEVGKELGAAKSYGEYEIRAASPDELEATLETVLKSKRIDSVIGSIMSLSK